MADGSKKKWVPISVTAVGNIADGLVRGSTGTKGDGGVAKRMA